MRQTRLAKDRVVAPGALDGVTILRYAHVYRGRTSGGVEQYLRQLDRGLLARHRITVLQMYLTSEDAADIDVENCGLGRIFWTPVPAREGVPTLGGLLGRIGYVCRRTFRMAVHGGARPCRAVFSPMRAMLRHRGGHIRHRAVVLSDHLERLIEAQRVDLLSVHWVSYETGALIQRARLSGVPFVLTNHFDNSRLAAAGVREWLRQAAAIGGVSGRNVPRELADRYVNLSDAVDTDFFAPEKARAAGPGRPIVLLPARIQYGKGHHDLLQAACILRDAKVDFQVIFAGGIDSKPLHEELRRSVADTGLTASVSFVGEQSAEELRAWYGRSRVVALPSYAEGLGRVLIEAQAMERPVVAYDCGGTSETLEPGLTGFLVEKGAVDALAERTAFLLGTEEEALHMGRRGREFVCRKFGVPALVSRYEAFYLDALCAGPSPAEARKRPAPQDHFEPDTVRFVGGATEVDDPCA